MFINNREIKPINLPVLKDDGSNKNDFFVADVIGNKSFVTNYGGHIRSDISLINDQSDLIVAKGLLAQLHEVPVLPDNSGVSDAELHLSLRSRYSQTNSEMLSVIESQLRKRDDARVLAQMNASSSSSVQPEPSVSE